MENNRDKTCGLTGHRPKDLPWKSDKFSFRFFFYKLTVKKLIKMLMQRGYTRFLLGMALGADIICADIIIKIKMKNPAVKLVCAIPCTNQTERWKKEDVIKYNEILGVADEIIYVSKRKYYFGCMQKRNKYIVDESSLIIATYNGKNNGGTKFTIDYAREKSVETIIINP